MNLPTKEDCKLIIDITYKVPANIVKHMIQVNRVANFIATKMKESGIDINIDLVDRAAILHDCLKVVDIPGLNIMFDPTGDKKVTISFNDRRRWMDLREKYAGFSHEEAAYISFREKYPEMSEVIKQHGYTDLTKEKSPKTWESKIVNYADKRVKHSSIVTLKERFEDTHKRYANYNFENKLDTEKVDKQYFALEKEIFTIIKSNPDEIENDIKDWELHSKDKQ